MTLMTYIVSYCKVK